MIEVEVHQQLQHLLRQSPEMAWPHQLTMARMVARGLRLGRNALIQVPAGTHHRLSYLLPALMWPGSTVVCVPEAVQQEILREEIPWLQQALDLHKPVQQISRWPERGFEGLALVDPCIWLQAQLSWDPEQRGGFPAGIPVVIDGAEHLERWARQVLTTQVGAADWLTLQMAYPHHRERIAEAQIQLSLSLLRRPGRRLRLHQDELGILRWMRDLVVGPAVDSDSRCLDPGCPDLWRQILPALEQPHQLWSAEVLHETGQVFVQVCPVAIESALRPLWTEQPFVLVGEGLDVEREALAYRERLGLPPLTTLRFLQTAQDPLPVVVPRLPVPNSPHFQTQLGPVLKHLICEHSGSAVVLVSDRPLQAQIGADLAAEFGSRVQVNRHHQRERGILVGDWDYWLHHKESFAVPQLLVMVTLPFPSTEDPDVAARVDYMRQQGQDWFRAYLMPLAAATMQRAISPLRPGSTRRHSEDPIPVVAILDNRIVTRSYGFQLLEALGPTIRTHVESLLV
jgi:ATP-dependent DNA helicase DinG